MSESHRSLASSVEVLSIAIRNRDTKNFKPCALYVLHRIHNHLHSFYLLEPSVYGMAMSHILILSAEIRQKGVGQLKGGN